MVERDFTPKGTHKGIFASSGNLLAKQTLVKDTPVPSEKLIWGFCGGKENRIMIKSDGRPRKHTVGIWLFPIA